MTQSQSTPSLATTVGIAAPSQPSSERLVSLDAYRGFIMLAMASAGLGISRVAKELHGTWDTVAAQVDHVPWVGCAVWDLIQPAFMFMVGVALPYSYASRAARGQTGGQMFRHAVSRSLILVALGVFCASASSKQTNFLFTNVLAQIGLGYTFVFLLRGRGVAMQAGAIAAIVALTCALFLLYPAPQPPTADAGSVNNVDDAASVVPAPPAEFDYVGYALPKDWPLMSGAAAHWNKHANVAAAFDLWFLNLFPRDKPYTLDVKDGGYQTLNFLPSLITMALGLMVGELLRGQRSRRAKLLVMLAAGAVLVAAGLLGHWLGCPIVKRLWTPSWALFSGGLVVWMLAAFYAVVEMAGWRRWTFPLVVVGMNSIVIYMMAQLMKPFTWHTLQIHLGWLMSRGPVDAVLRWLFGSDGFPAVYLPIVECGSVLMVFWLICLWLHRQKIFVRI